MDQNTNSNGGSKKHSCVHTFFTLIYILLSDIVVYGGLIPLSGAYIGGAGAKMFEAPPRWELVFVVVATFILMYAAFCVFGEGNYWKHLFAFDSVYRTILYARDIMNAFLFVLCIILITTTVEEMVVWDNKMKSPYMSEGSTYVFLKMVCDVFSVEHSALEPLELNPYGENKQFEHAGAYVLYFAMLTATIAKIVYFNTLFAYLRAMEIFISMGPSFDDNDDDNKMDIPTALNFGRRSAHSKLGIDFVQSIKASQVQMNNTPTPNVDTTQPKVAEDKNAIVS